MDQAFKARVWQQRRTIRDLDLALSEAQERWIRVQRARKSVPTNTGEFASRVAALQARIAGLQTRLTAMRQRQNDYLARLAVSELEAQKTRLSAYEVQARFELASMYDRAQDQASAAAPKSPAGRPAAPESGAAPSQEPHP
jgi:chromosome segregation ATPase